jgi:1A family penicillin-binding protein
MKERRKDVRKRNRLFLAGTFVLFLAAGILLWGASLRIPDLTDLSAATSVAQSTKIYDRTGKVLLYDMSQNVRRTEVPYEDISPNVKHAVLAIEDKNFYNHGGIDFRGIGRAIFTDVTHFSFSQGGSTITQQVVKNTILTNDKTPTRKIKEAILAEKLEGVFTKDQILNIYLNAIPLGGPIYGVEEASKSFFNKSSKDLTVAESAYIAAMIQAPTFYSPYGSHKEALETRKNVVLHEMLADAYITQDEYAAAQKEVVAFSTRQDTGGIKAPHFVFFVINYLEDKYGDDALQHGGLKVTTTLDWNIEQSVEKTAKEFGVKNQKNFNASNNATVVLDPKTGDVLSMVGSRDYFDNAISGNFNVATSPHRQPGSTFKPFVYATLFEKGFTPNSILFDVPTQFSVNCAASNFTGDNGCFSPQNFDSKFRGPITIRDALALSINIPAVKALYVAGVDNSIQTAKAMGISTLLSANQYGLTLVLGSGQVSLLEMTSAYGVFANDGVRTPYRSVLKVEDTSGTVLEEGDVASTQVIPAEPARQISDILSDNNAKAPEYGIDGSPFYFPGRQVASKTGTTNNSVDAWVIGYTPNVVVGVWSGNNNNTPMVKKVAGLIVAPMWHVIMNEVLQNLPSESFIPPQPIDPNLKPVLRGDWQAEYGMGGVHNILYWINKKDPTGAYPSSPASDSEYSNWEYGVQNWLNGHPYNPPVATPAPTYPTTGATGTSPNPYLFPPTPTQTTPTTNVPASNPYGYILQPDQNTTPTPQQ